MSNGKQTNEHEWRHNFLTWEKGLSGDGEKNDVLWERLIVRLQVSGKKKAAYFVWAAAALLLLSGLFFLWKYPSFSGQMYSGTFKTRSHLINSHLPEKQVVPGSAWMEKPAKQKTTIKTTGASPDLPAVEQPVVIGLVGVDSLKIATIIPSAQSKKIRVVHMNEWFSPPPPVFAKSKEEEEAPYKPSVWPGKNRRMSPPSSNN